MLAGNQLIKHLVSVFFATKLHVHAPKGLKSRSGHDDRIGPPKLRSLTAASPLQISRLPLPALQHQCLLGLCKQNDRGTGIKIGSSKPSAHRSIVMAIIQRPTLLIIIYHSSTLDYAAKISTAWTIFDLLY